MSAATGTEATDLPDWHLQMIALAIEHPKEFSALGSRMASDDDERQEHRRSAEYQDLLVAGVAALKNQFTFADGDVIFWKPKLKNKNRPEYGEPCVVIHTYSEPLMDESKSAGSAYFREPLDLQIGVLNSDLELIIYHADSRRFMPQGISDTAELEVGSQ